MNFILNSILQHCMFLFLFSLNNGCLCHKADDVMSMFAGTDADDKRTIWTVFYRLVY